MQPIPVQYQLQLSRILPYFVKRKQVTYDLNLSYNFFSYFTKCALLVKYHNIFQVSVNKEG